MKTDTLDLLPRHRDIIVTILREHVPGVEVWAYGSRVNGRSHPGSDLDLVLRAPQLERIPPDRLDALETALHDSNVPFLIEVRDWAGLPDSFHREMAREHVVLIPSG